MLKLSSRARLLALVILLVVAAVVVLFLWFRPSLFRPEPGLGLPSVLPSIPLHSASASGSPAPEPEVMLAVGDIGSCKSRADDAIADLASRLPGTIALLGDVAYERGSTDDFRDCFDPSWGSMRRRMRPAVGNHEYLTSGAAGYFSYFGARAGTPGEGWYSYDLGAWHVVVLNSNCSLVGCDPGSPQLNWLHADLADADAGCLLAYWHAPRYSSGRHGSQSNVQPFWDELVAAGADVILNGHDHTYERHSVNGLREFVVGTGGRSLYPFQKAPLPSTEVRNDSAYGLLWLSLGEGTYDWQFVALGTSGFTDTGSGSCD